MSIFISKDTTRRLLKDVRQIIKEPLTDSGIHYLHDPEDMLKGYALIIGQKDTPYYGGTFLFELIFTNDYPYKPPSVTYHTNGYNIRFHPNLYRNGKVCLSLLNTWRGDQWTSCQTISSVLLTISSIFTEDSLIHEPGITLSDPDVAIYNKIISYYTILVTCDIIEEKIQSNFFRMFKSIMIDNFRKNYSDMKDYIDNKIVMYPGERSYKTRVYNMNVVVDYNIALKAINTAYNTLK